MKKMRVGTFSLGILLIAMGFVILMAQINQYDIVDKILTWWPVILILLGGEILWQIYTSKENELAVKYDVLSMLIIVVLIFFSLGACTLSSVGIIDIAAQTLSASNYNLEIPTRSIEINEVTEEIIIKIPGDNLTVEKGPESKVVLFGTASVNAVDLRAAENIVNQTKLVSREEGNKLYVTIIPIPRPTGIKPRTQIGQYTLLLPTNIKVRIESSQYFNMKISSDTIECIYLIQGDGNGTIAMNVPETADLWIEAVMSGSYRLSGNVEWDITGNDKDDSPIRSITGTLKWGDGKNKITILKAGYVEVNEL